MALHVAPNFSTAGDRLDVLPTFDEPMRAAPAPRGTSGNDYAQQEEDEASSHSDQTVPPRLVKCKEAGESSRRNVFQFCLLGLLLLSFLGILLLASNTLGVRLILLLLVANVKLA